MSPYRIELLTADGALQDERVIDCRDDDEAVDRTGDIDHLHAMSLWQGGRHVAHFPPWTD